MMTQNLQRLVISPQDSLRRAMECINSSACGLALIVEADGRLIRTLTDGDIRRAVLAGIPFDASVGDLIGRKDIVPWVLPFTARVGTKRSELLLMMKERSIHHVPLLDDAGRVVDVCLMDNLLEDCVLPLQAVVMAGGFGKRLHPLTNEVPKPMLPVGDKPILEHIMGQLQASGIHKVKLTTHFKPEAISSHFGDGSGFGVDISYVNEDEPLGTAGALGLVETSEHEPVLLMNGDILTRVDFRAMLEFHREQKAELTVGVRQFDLRVPYGVVKCEGARVQGVEEKPTLNFLVNAGIYLIEPSAQRLIPAGRRFDMTDLIAELSARGRPVVAFPIVEYWLDIGRPEDYLRAQQDIQTWNQ